MRIFARCGGLLALLRSLLRPDEFCLVQPIYRRSSFLWHYPHAHAHWALPSNQPYGARTFLIRFHGRDSLRYFRLNYNLHPQLSPVRVPLRLREGARAGASVTVLAEKVVKREELMLVPALRALFKHRL